MNNKDAWSKHDQTGVCAEQADSCQIVWGTAKLPAVGAVVFKTVGEGVGAGVVGLRVALVGAASTMTETLRTHGRNMIKSCVQNRPAFT